MGHIRASYLIIVNHVSIVDRPRFTVENDRSGSHQEIPHTSASPLTSPGINPIFDVLALHMATHIGVPHLDIQSRPNLHRSRSHSSPSQNATGPQSAIIPPTRPIHGRSQSYLSPAEPKPRNAATLPTPASTLEKASSRLHLPGKHHLHHDHHRRHKHRQSEEQHHLRRKSRDRATDSLPNLVAGINAERAKRAAATSQNEDKNTTNDPASGGLARVKSARSYRGADAAFADLHGRYGGYGRSAAQLRRPATNESTSPQAAYQQRARNPVEADIERAERLKRQRRFTLTQADVVRRDKEIDDAEDEMREKLEQIHASGIDITRRLDYGYYNLLEKVGNLVGTIQSFQTLTTQSAQLVVNFENEGDRLDKDMKRRIEVFKTSFEEREERVEKMETRGKEVQKKAESLGRRLDNARIMIQNWEKREDRAKKVWGRFWGCICWSLISIIILILALVMWKEWWFRGDPVKAGMGVRSGGHRNKSLTLGDGGPGEQLLRQGNLPDDVQAILEGIEFRNRRRKDFATPVTAINESTVESMEGDEILCVLDEL